MISDVKIWQTTVFFVCGAVCSFYTYYKEKVSLNRLLSLLYRRDSLQKYGFYSSNKFT